MKFHAFVCMAHMRHIIRPLQNQSFWKSYQDLKYNKLEVLNFAHYAKNHYSKPLARGGARQVPRAVIKSLMAKRSYLELHFDQLICGYWMRSSPRTKLYARPPWLALLDRAVLILKFIILLKNMKIKIQNNNQNCFHPKIQ